MTPKPTYNVRFVGGCRAVIARFMSVAEAEKFIQRMGSDFFEVVLADGKRRRNTAPLGVTS